MSRHRLNPARCASQLPPTSQVGAHRAPAWPTTDPDSQPVGWPAHTGDLIATDPEVTP